MHTTNFSNTFVAVAEDCAAETGCIPPEKSPPTIARMQYDMIASNPYRYTSDEIVFSVYARKNDLRAEEIEGAEGRLLLERAGVPPLFAAREEVRLAG